MFIKTFFTVFITIFFAEMADKTQLATILYSSDAQYSRWAVFFGSALALVIASAIGVFLGSIIGKYINPEKLKIIGGIGFIIVGIWTLLR